MLPFAPSVPVIKTKRSARGSDSFKLRFLCPCCTLYYMQLSVAGREHASKWFSVDRSPT